MDLHAPFVSLLFITVLAALVPFVVSRVRIVRLPIVVGEIAAGILIGKSGLNLVQSTPTLDFLAGFGFAFLMFLSGLEVNFTALVTGGGGDTPRPRWQRPVPLAILIFSATVLLALGIGAALAAIGLTENAVLMGLILSTTSVGVVVPVLKERGLIATPYGQTLLVTALISDFATLLLLSLTIAVTRKGPSLDLLLFMILLVAFVAAAKLGHWARRVPGLTRLLNDLSHATAQVQVRGAFALMIIWVVLAEALGVETILGAFLAGAVISVSRPSAESPLREKLEALGFGFFIPLFFIMVGANFDLPALLGSPAALLLVPVLIGAAYLVKVGPALLFRSVFPWRETWAAGTLLAARLSLIIAASAIALELQLITPPVNAAIILVAVVTCTLSPILFGRILGPGTEQARQGVIILGTGPLGRLLAGRLRRDGEPITFIAPDPQPLADLQQAGFATVAGDPRDPAVLAAAGAAQAAALISVTNAPELVLAVCGQAKGQFGVPVLIANLDDPRYTRPLAALEVRLVQPTTATALALESALRFPAAFRMLTERGDGVDLADAQLVNAALVGRALRQVRLPGNVLVLGIRRQGEVIIPHGDTSLQGDDMLMLVGQPDDLRIACGLIEGRPILAPVPTAQLPWPGWKVRWRRPATRAKPPMLTPQRAPARRPKVEH
jgi:Kef-type K+ transport system membrane component KefB/Trk K+ transport system NAD-binding subunit